MSYILLYSERYGYYESFHDGCVRHTRDFHCALNFDYLDGAMRIREFLNARYDGDYHIKVFTAEGQYDGV